MELVAQVLVNLFSMQTLMVCFLGTTVEVILGAIPGMNEGMGIAIMLPFIYAMRPEQGLLFLGGIYLGSSCGDSISGILTSYPETAEASCTALEGYQMTRKGEGKRALYLSITASSIGSLIGLIILLFFAPMSSSTSVRFDPPEMILLAIYGLTIVGSLTGKNVPEGLPAALAGLSLAMIGIDGSTDIMRSTFGFKALRGDIDLIPTIISLFAIAEMTKQGIGLNGDGDDEEILWLQKTRFIDIWKKAWRNYTGVLLKSSAIGAFIEILPGTGGAIASFLTYGEAKGRDKEGTFGQGNPARIVVLESTNNAAMDRSLVPMLSLGISGSSTSAIMFGALTIHGLVPGQRSFVGHGDIVYTFILRMFLAVVVMMVIGIFGIPVFASVLKLNIRYIIPVVLMCSLTGAYSINNSVYDAYVAIGMGIFGVVLTKLGIPNAPVVLGLILGSIIESNPVKTYTIVSAQGRNIFLYILARPLYIGILLLTTHLIYTNIKTLRKGKRVQQDSNIEQDLQEE